MYAANKSAKKVIAANRRVKVLREKDDKSSENDSDIATRTSSPVFKSAEFPATSSRDKPGEFDQCEELARFVADSWTDLASSQSIIHHREPSNSCLNNFIPFDLDSWMSRRLFDLVIQDL